MGSMTQKPVYAREPRVQTSIEVGEGGIHGIGTRVDDGLGCESLGIFCWWAEEPTQAAGSWVYETRGYERWGDDVSLRGGCPGKLGGF